MINNPIDFYMPTKLDQNSQSLTLIIQPNTATQAQTTIYYKMKDMWTFKIGGGLTIQNITFDAIDSVIDPNQDSTLCLNKTDSSCCFFNELSELDG